MHHLSALSSCNLGNKTNWICNMDPTGGQSPAKACTGQSTTAGKRRVVWVKRQKENKEKSSSKGGVGGCAECDVLVWSLSASGVASPLTPLSPFPWSPHTISVCRTSKDGSSPSCSPPSSSSPMWQLWREVRASQGRDQMRSWKNVLRRVRAGVRVKVSGDDAVLPLP